MSDKLKIMQAKLQGAKRNYAPRAGFDTVWYRFITCSVFAYYVEVLEEGGLSVAIAQLINEFGIDPDTYCKGCQVPMIQSVSIVDAGLVPKADDNCIFVRSIFATC
jgi:hypothetical protein